MITHALPLPSRLAIGAMLLALVLPATGVPAQATAPTPPTTPTTLASRIDAYIAQPQFARADWGIAVRSPDGGKAIYRHHADRLFVPASSAKLFTAALALAKLGSNTRIATTLYATSTRVSTRGVLRGDLILYGRGDPSLGLPDGVTDWADRMAAALARRGVKRVEGNLVADATYFSGTPIGGGWEANDLQSWYATLPSALSVQGNLIHVDVARDGRTCCTVSVTPDAAGIHIQNRTAEVSTDPLGLYRPVGSSTLYVVGQLPARTPRRDYRLSMPDPARTAGNLLRQAMARHGIVLAGEVKVLHWPDIDTALTQPGTQALANIESPPIAALVDHMLKKSDNLFAQALLRQVGVVAAQRGDCSAARKPDTSTGWALCSLDGLLAAAGIAPDEVLLTEGSGLARRDLVTPDAFTRLLAWSTTQPWGTDLRSALPVAGIDGTLQNRFRDGPATANLQAKTGTISHAYTLTGFVTDASGKRLVFSIMLNRYPRWQVARLHPGTPSPQHALDDIARMLAGSDIP